MLDILLFFIPIYLDLIFNFIIFLSIALSFALQSLFFKAPFNQGNETFRRILDPEIFSGTIF
jgi:hypothetical protein